MTGRCRPGAQGTTRGRRGGSPRAGLLGQSVGVSPPARYVESGGSWRTFHLLAAVFVTLAVLDGLVPGDDVPLLLWVVSIVGVLGIVATGVVSANRVWSVSVVGRGPGATLTVGRESLPLSDVDLAALHTGSTGVDVGAPVLGGGVTLPKGRVGLPLRRTDGATVLVPTRRPAQLTEALLTAHPGAAASSDAPGTVDS